MSGATLDAILFLVSCIFDFYIMVLVIRLVLAYVNADYNHPLTQFVIKLTSAVVKPLKKFLPDIRGIETATIVLIFIVTMFKCLILNLLSFGIPNLLGVFIYSIGDVLRLFLLTISIALLIQALLSFIQPASPAYGILSRATAPLLRPLQRFIPPISGVDITPIVAIVILQLLFILIARPIMSYGLAVAVGS